jgi:hypothetical protein
LSIIFYEVLSMDIGGTNALDFFFEIYDEPEKFKDPS